MCTNQREIVNKYTGHRLYVKCGHCPACLQEKAAFRVTRIKSQDSEALECVLVGLTYRRNDCPYVFRQDAYRFAHGELIDEDGKYLPLSVWRDHSYRKVRMSSDYKIGYKDFGPELLCEIDPIMVDHEDVFGKHETKPKYLSFSGNKDLAYVQDKIGVCYYPDVQEFMARLRINLSRKYNISEFYGVTRSLTAYLCSEYGSRSNRPHFHLLLWIPKGTFETFRSAIIESWPYGDLSKFDRSVEKAFRASSYVASYVNLSYNFSSFLRTYFAPKHSYSKGFGVERPVFQLPKILERFKRGNLNLFVQKEVDGLPKVCELPTPKYVIHRYFPKFKGYCRIAPSSLLECMQRLTNFSFTESKQPIETTSRRLTNLSDLQYLDKLSFPVHFSADDIYSISVRLKNAFKRFKESSPPEYSNYTIVDYFRLHVRVWSLYSSNVLRLCMTNDFVPLQERYDNLEEIKCKYESTLKYDLPIGFNSNMLRVTDPNLFASTQAMTRRYSKSYYEHVKHRSVSNAVLSSLYEEF